jgi:hypothetical protein
VTAVPRSGAGSAEPSDGEPGPGESQTPERGGAAPPERAVRYELDVRNERAIAWLRIVGSVVVAGGVIWLLSLGPGLIGVVLGAVGGLASLGWLLVGLRGRKRANEHAGAHYLEVSDEGFVLAEGAKVQRVRWSEVKSVAVDEDRLVVRVERKGAEPGVVVEPRYRGQSVYALAEALAPRLAKPAEEPQEPPSPSPSDAKEAEGK